MTEELYSMRSIRLIQYTDTHLQADPEASLRGKATFPALRATLDHADHHFPAADAVLLTGDLVQDDAGGYALIRETFENSRVPVLCLPGNHDVPDAMRAALSQPPFQVGGHALLGNWLVVMLDTWMEGSAGGFLGAEKLASLDQLLAAHRDRHALVCLHHHPISMQSRWLDTVGLMDADAFRNVIERHVRVRGVLWGHVHQALDRLIKGVRYMATPATCVQFLPRNEQFAIDQRPPGYRVLELMPDGSIATEVVWVESVVARQTNSTAA